MHSGVHLTRLNALLMFLIVTKKPSLSIPFNYKRVCFGIASHTLMVHAVDVYNDLGYIDAVKVNEEGLDHFFSFLYAFVPLIFGPVAGVKASASNIWQATLEGWATGMRVPNSARNRSYV